MLYQDKQIMDQFQESVTKDVSNGQINVVQTLFIQMEIKQHMITFV